MTEDIETLFLKTQVELNVSSRLLDELADVCHCSDGGECITMLRDSLKQAELRLSVLETGIHHVLRGTKEKVTS